MQQKTRQADQAKAAAIGSELISLRAYARLRKLNVATVSRHAKAGKLTLIDGKINPKIADIEWVQNIRARVDNGGATTQVGRAVEKSINPGRAPEESGDAGDSYWESRRRREAAEASIAEMAEKEKRGTLINREGAERAMETAFRFMRDSVLATVDRMPIDRALAFELRGKLNEALADAAKVLPSLGAAAGETVQ